MIIIGRRDKIDLPALNIFGIEAKVDTGAYGCALHSHHTEIVEREGKELLSFRVLDPSHPEYNDKVFFVEDFYCKEVKSSSGEKELRFTFVTQVTLFDTTQDVEFSLTNRIEMKYPVLLGRKILAKQFLVDVQKKDLSYKKKIIQI